MEQDHIWTEKQAAGSLVSVGVMACCRQSRAAHTSSAWGNAVQCWCSRLPQQEQTELVVLLAVGCAR